MWFNYDINILNSAISVEITVKLFQIFKIKFEIGTQIETLDENYFEIYMLKYNKGDK